MRYSAYLRWLLVAAIVLAIALAAHPAVAGTAAGTQIQNVVTATYQDGGGRDFASVSNTLSVTVAAVSSLILTPKENGCDPATDSYAVGNPVTKTFTILNSSNVADAYTIASAQTTAGTVTSLAFFTSGGTTPAVAGSTVSPTVPPGGTLGVRVVVSAPNVAAGGKFSVSLAVQTTVTGTANGLQTDSAAQCAVAGLAAAIAGPQGPGTLVDKRVDGTTFVQSAPGSTVTYSLAFKNTGEVPALNAVLNDPLPAGILPDLSSVQLNGKPVPATLAGQVLKVPVGTLAPGVQQVVSFAATVGGVGVAASIVNVASVAADNAAAVSSEPAAVWPGNVNVVFDGYGGAAQTLPNATLTLVGASNPPGTSFPASTALSNPPAVSPVVSGSGGTYDFTLAPSQIGSASSPAYYTLTVTAPGYVNRSIGVTLTPDASGLLYSATLAALDAQPLAVPGGFALTPGPVTLANVAGIFGNIPLFQKSVVQISKSVDRQVAAAGDRLVWTLQYSNSAPGPLGLTKVVDNLPAGIVYAPGTGRLDGQPLEPAQTGRLLEWSFPTLDTKPHTIVFATVLMPGVSEGSLLTNTASIAAVVPGAQGATASASAQADVRIIAGIYSSCTTLVGRVYRDTQKTGHFERGDRGIPDVRIFLESGESVTTDPDGRFSFACVREGMHVARLDPTTLPPNARPYADRRYDSERSIRRLVHGIFDAMTVEDLNFAIEDAR